MLIHDNVILSYEVNLQNDQIVIHTLKEAESKAIDIVFTDVFSHHFEHQLKGSIILALTEWDIPSFINGNAEMLQKGKSYGWPTRYESIDELQKELMEGKYRYISLLSSYGMNGWILAKHVEIVTR